MVLIIPLQEALPDLRQGHPNVQIPDFGSGALMCLTNLLINLMCFQVSLLELERMLQCHARPCH